MKKKMSVSLPRHGWRCLSALGGVFAKQKLLCIIAAWMLLLCTCSTGNESAVISISFGTGTVPGKAVVSVDQLRHVITLSGPTGTQTHTISGAGTMKATVFPGLWIIDVAAYLGDELYAVGSGSTEVKAGKTSNVLIQMTVVWTDTAGVPNGNGTVTINLGGANNSVADWGPYQQSDYGTFKYTIVIKDSSGKEQIIENVVFGGSASFQASTGTCDLSIYAYDSAGNELKAVSFARPSLSSGSNNVTIQMKLPLTPIKEQTGAWQAGPYGSITVTKGALQPDKYDDFDVVADPSNSQFLFVNWVASDDINSTVLYTSATLSSITINKNTSMYAVFDGDGTYTPKNISSESELNGMVTGEIYALMADMTLAVWMPLGNLTTPFTGSFDGRGHNINFGTINTTNNGYAGLFGYIDSGATVKNFSLKGEIDVTAPNGSMYAGAVAGKNEGTIENVSSSVNVKATNNGYSNPSDANSGGIAGSNTGFITNCYITGPVHSTASADSGGNDNAEAGGIAYNGGTINYCWVSGAISTSSPFDDNWQFAGGITGSNFSTVSHCVALNPSITTSGGAGRGNRISGYPSGSPPFLNCYANQDMLVDGSQKTGGTTTDETGANVSLSDAGQQDWWGTTGNWSINSTGGSESSPWVWDDANKRPMLWFESAVNQ